MKSRSDYPALVLSLATMTLSAGCGSPTEEAPTGPAAGQAAFSLDEGTLTLNPAQQGLFCRHMPLGFFESSHHVLNTGETPMDIHGRFDIHVAKAEEIDFPMGVLFANALQVDVAPNSQGSVEGTITVPEAIDLVVLTSHAHNFL